MLFKLSEKSVEVLAAEDEVVAQVLVAYGRVVGQLLACALEQDLALKHRERASKKK